MKMRSIIASALVATLLASCATRGPEEGELLRELDRVTIHLPPPAFEGEPSSSCLKRVENLINAKVENPIAFRVYGYAGREIPLEVQPIPPPGIPTLGGIDAAVPDVIAIVAEMGEFDYEVDDDRREIIFQSRKKTQPSDRAYTLPRPVQP